MFEATVSFFTERERQTDTDRHRQTDRVGAGRGGGGACGRGDYVAMTVMRR